MAIKRKSVAGKTVPGEKRLPAGPSGKKLPGGPGGKSFPKKDLPTKRQRILAKVKNPGADGNEKGTVRGKEEKDLEWRDDSGQQEAWIPAVYHNNIREKLLAEASDEGRLVYDYPRYKGFLPNDETAFLSSQQHWGADRSLWHLIPDDLLNRFKRLDYKGKDYDVVYMFDEGRIVLDMDNHPVLDYEDIPSVLSSNFGMKEEGFILEAIRRIDQRIERSDFLARMPWERKSRENGKVEPLFTLSSIGNRQYRWRKDNGLATWVLRSGSKNLGSYIGNKLSQQALAENSTRELVNGLTKEEKKEAELPNKGVMLNRAGRRQLTDDVRREREENSKKSKQRPQKKQKLMRKAPESFDTDIEDEHLHSSQRSRENSLQNEDDGKKTQQRKRHQASTLKRQKRTAPANFDDDSDEAGNHDAKRAKTNAYQTEAHHNSPSVLKRQKRKAPATLDEDSDEADDHDAKRTRTDAQQTEGHDDGPSQWLVNQSLPNTPPPNTHYANGESYKSGHQLDELQQDDVLGAQIEASSHAFHDPTTILSESLGYNNLHIDEDLNLVYHQSTSHDDIGDAMDAAAALESHRTHLDHELDTNFFKTPWNGGLTFSSGQSYHHEALEQAEFSNPSFEANKYINNPGDLIAASTNLNSSTKQSHEDYNLEADQSPEDISAIRPNRQKTYHSGHEVSLSPPPRFVTPPLPESFSNKYTEGDLAFSSDKTSGGSVDVMNNTLDTTPTESPPSRIDPTQDYRFKQPQSDVDAVHIEEALDLTRHDFLSLFGDNVFGEEVPVAKYWDSYAKQYAVLQKQAIFLQAPGSVVIYLNHWDAWVGGFDKWKGTTISKDDFLQVSEVDEVDADGEAGPSQFDEMYGQLTGDTL